MAAPINNPTPKGWLSRPGTGQPSRSKDPARWLL